MSCSGNWSTYIETTRTRRGPGGPAALGQLAAAAAAARPRRALGPHRRDARPVVATGAHGPVASANDRTGVRVGVGSLVCVAAVPLAIIVTENSTAWIAP